MFDLSGMTALVTGASGGIGSAIARSLASQGARLALSGSNSAKLRAFREELNADYGHDHVEITCDLSNATEVASLVDQVKVDHANRVRALVHMAGGFAMSGPVAESSIEIWNRMISINLTTAFLTTRAFLPLLRRTRGSIVLFSAQPALPGGIGPNMSAYTVAKTGVAALMRAIAAEERQRGVRANAVAPVAIRTAANVSEMGNDAHLIERESVADVVTFLCSDAARNITGELISIS